LLSDNDYHYRIREILSETQGRIHVSDFSPNRR